MDKNKAMKLIYDQYEKIKEIAYEVELKYFKKRGMYHEDVTHDMYLKMYKEIEKIEKPDLILKYLDRMLGGQMYIIYRQAKQMYINLLKKENKYVAFDYQKLTKREKDRLIEMPEKYQEFDDNIQKKVDDYVKTFYWFDQKLFDLYRYEFKMHKTEMSKKTKISYSTIYRTVKRCKVKIKDKLKGDYYE